MVEIMSISVLRCQMYAEPFCEMALFSVMYLADVGGLATHVGASDDLEPGLPSGHAAVILDEVHPLLGFYAWVPEAINSIKEDKHQIREQSQYVVEDQACPCWGSHRAWPSNAE